MFLHPPRTTAPPFGLLVTPNLLRYSEYNVDVGLLWGVLLDLAWGVHWYYDLDLGLQWDLELDLEWGFGLGFGR